MYFDLKFGLVCCLNAQPIHLTILTNYLSYFDCFHRTFTLISILILDFYSQVKVSLDLILKLHFAILISEFLVLAFSNYFRVFLFIFIKVGI